MSQFTADLAPDVREWARTNVEGGKCRIELIEELYTKFRLHPVLCLIEVGFDETTVPDADGEWKRRIAAAGPIPAKSAEPAPRAPRQAITAFYENGRSHLVPQSARRLAHTDLEIYVVDDFMSKRECARAIDMMRDRMHPSTITSKTEPDKYYRTSSTSELNDFTDEPGVDVLDRKIAAFLGVKPEYSEGIQGQMYQVGQEFKKHTDYIDPSSAEYREHTAIMGQRTWTFMVYLNNVKEGGETHFTHVDKLFEPKRGQAVIWNNLKPDGSENPASIHWGTKIRKGEKWIITKWFRERASARNQWAHTDKTKAELQTIRERLQTTLEADNLAYKATEAETAKTRAAAILQNPQQGDRGAIVGGQQQHKANTHVDPNFTLRKSLYFCQMMAHLATMDSRPPKLNELHSLPTADELRNEYFSHNRLLVVRGAGQETGWPIAAWDFAFLREQIGDLVVQVQDGRSTDPNFEFNKVDHRKKMPFSEFMDKCENGPQNDIYLTANNSECKLNRVASNIVLGTLPDFKEQYLEPGWLTRSSLLWVGNEGGFTPLHHDDANIVHTQVAGTKEWRACPPWYAHKLANFSTVFTRISDPWDIDYDLFPEARNIPWLDFTLHPGDTVMLPQGWMHAVRCHGNNISISSTDVSSGILNMLPSP